MTDGNDTHDVFLLHLRIATPVIIIGVFILSLGLIYLRHRERQRQGYHEISNGNGDAAATAATPTTPTKGTSKATLYWCIILVIATYLGNAASIVAKALIERQWSTTSSIVYAAGNTVVWSCILACMLGVDKFQHAAIGRWNWPFVATWWVGFVMETVNGLLVANDGATDGYMLAGIILAGIRWLLLFVMLWVNHFIHVDISTSSSLEAGNSNAYGTFDQHPGGQVNPAITASAGKLSMTEYLRKFKPLIPSLIPRGFWLQVCVAISFLLLVIGRAVVVFTPQELGKVTDELAKEHPEMPWKHLLLYIGLQYIGSTSGLLTALQNILWIPVSQYTSRTLQLQVFEHLHTLSLQYHLQRKTGEVIRIVDRGSAINNLFQVIVFNILPVIADIILAVIYFAFKFDIWFAFFVFVTMAVYLFITVALTNWRTKFRRLTVELDNDARTKMTDSLLNFETVKYYTAEAFEVNRYATAIRKYQKAELKTQASLNILNVSQALVITLGLLGGCLVAAYRVTLGQMTVGDFVLFITYLNQLIRPLNWIGTYYRMINTYMIDTEKMVDLLAQHPSVKDKPEAEDLKVADGEIIFDNVDFSYDPRAPALRDITFTVPPGKTVALVGESGGGKTSILRLLFRFYDVTKGRILIDGQDIRDVTQKSLRKNIGVVPQDSVLSNDTIAYNIGYGRPDEGVSQDEIEAAAKAAQIHDKIIGWPDKYDTKVGERGLRLSGGEKQRTAIARTMVKNPPIILLDEATSALDTMTERQIQNALTALSAGRTTLVVAHRLSTVVNADVILVIQGGRIVEKGSHNELVDNNGFYAEMYQKQMQDVEPADSSGSSIKSSEGRKESGAK